MKALQASLRDLATSILWYLDYYLDLILTFPLKLKKIHLDNIRNILVIELLYIGDIVALTSSLNALKKQLPKVKITLIVNQSMKDLLLAHPSIDNIISVNLEELKQAPDVLLDKIKEKYDLAFLIHPHPLIGSWFMSKLLRKAKIPYRIGGTRVGLAEGRGFFMHRRAKPYFGLHHKSQDIADVFESAGINVSDLQPSLSTTKEADIWAKNFLKKNKIAPSDKLIIFHPAPRHKSHAWFVERWSELADILSQKHRAKIVLTGTKDDLTMHKEIINKSKAKIISAAGTSIQQFCSLIKHSSLVISVDTGAMHIAAAFQIPVISLFGAGNPQIWKPYSNNSQVIFKEQQSHTGCMLHNCYLKGSRYMECMKAISVGEVYETIGNNFRN